MLMLDEHFRSNPQIIGFSNRHIYASVLIQAAILTGLAFAFAVGVVAALAIVGPRLAPILSLSIESGALLQIGLAGLGVALVGTLVVARRLARVDPMSAFSE